MSRLLLVAIALAGCHGAASNAPPPAPPSLSTTNTCDDAGAHAAALLRVEAPDQPVDQAELAQPCVDEAWSQELIDCFVASSTAHDADACFADLIAASPVCQTLASLVEAGRDPLFSSIQGAAATDAPYDVVSTVALSGATACGIYTRTTPAKVQCDMFTTDDPTAASDAYSEIAYAVDNCLSLTGWAAEDLGRNNLKWTSATAELPDVFLEVYDLSGSTVIRVNVAP